MRIASLCCSLFLVFQMVVMAELDVGGGHSLYLRSDGSLWGSGRNNFGQLMDHANPNVYSPVQLVSGNVVDFAAGLNFTLYVKDDGSAWGTGENGNGQLGQGNTFNTTQPYQIFGGNVVEVVAGDTWSAFRLSDGSLWTCGYNLNGQLGTGNTTQHEIPVQIESTGVVELSAGTSHLIYRKSDGSVYGTGQNGNGQLGDGSSVDQNSPIQIFSGNIVALATGDSHSLFLSGNLVYASGYNFHYQLGDGTNTTQPTAIYTGHANVTAIYAGANKSGWTDSSNDTYVVGENAYSELGDGASPVQIPFKTTSTPLNDMILAQDYMMLENTSGLVKGRGQNTDGQLGSSTASFASLKKTNYPESYGAKSKIEARYASDDFHVEQGLLLTFIIQDSAGKRVENDDMTNLTLTPSSSANILRVITGEGDGTYAVDANPETIQARQGVVAVIVSNDVLENFTVSVTNDGGLTDPSTLNLETKTNVSSVKLESHASTTFVLEHDGTLRGSGQNSSYELGHSSGADQQDPIIVSSGNILDVAAGLSHTLMVTHNGELWGVGSNGVDQFGNTGFATHQSPVRIVAGNVVATRAADNSSYYLLNNGDLYGIGENAYGQLGDGTTLNRNTPVFISANVVDFDAGTRHLMYIQRDGSLWGVGVNSSGQLGDGTGSDQYNPVQVMSGNVSRVFCTQDSTFITITNGELWGFGLNDYGQLGLGHNGNELSPKLISDRHIVHVAGYNHSLLLSLESALFVAGRNFDGQLGDTLNTDINYLSLEHENVVSMTAGSGYSMVNDSGEIKGFGINGAGQLGNSTLGAGSFNSPQTSNFPNIIGRPVDVVVTKVPSSLGVDQQGELQVEIQDEYGNLIESDFTTSITFTPSGNGQIFGVIDGFGDGSYGIDGAVETVLVNGGIARVLISDNAIGSLDFTITNDASLTNPTFPSIALTADAFLGKVSAGQNFSLYLTADGEMYGAGQNNYGQLADPGLADQLVARFIESEVIDISAGLTSSYFVKSDGSFWGMGRGFYGELGRGLTNDESTPVQIVAGSVERVEAGKNFVLYLKSNGSLWGVGRNDFGQLGDGSTVDRSNVYEIFDTDIIDFSAGSTHSLFLKNDGSAWAVGENNHGQLGDASNVNTSTPVAVSGLSANVIAVSAGHTHSLFLKSDGSLWSTGYNTYGQLGDGTNSAKNTPVQVVAGNVIEIYAAYQSSFFKKNDGSLWAMGQGINGEFGDGSNSDVNSPVQVLASGLFSMDSNHSHSLFLMDDGKVQASGQEDNGEFAVNYSGPRSITARLDTNFIQSNAQAIVANSYSVSAINTTFNPAQGTVVTIKVLDGNGDIIVTENTLEFTLSVNASATIDNVNKGQGDGAYGSNSEVVTVRNGQATITINDAVIETFDLTISNNRSVSGQSSVEFETDTNASTPKVEAGWETSFYLTNVGELYGSGRNDFGQIGDGSASDQSNPVLVYSSNILDVASGYRHTLFLMTDGSVWASGENNFGQLGDGTITNQSSPVQIFGGNVVKVWAGENHSLFLLNNNELWGTGKNTEGQLGDGSSVDRSSPVLVAADVIEAAAGQHTIFIKSDGTLWGCGYNFYGQVGDGTTTNHSSPVQVMSDVERCFAGNDFSFVIKSDGSLWGMGRGDFGQLGDGTSTNHQTPVQILANGARELTGGTSHTLMIKDDGSLWAFGSGTSGQLGDGASVSQSSPVQIESSGVTSIAAGQDFSIYIKNGRVYFMGNNGFGALGDSSQGAGSFNTPISTNYPDLVGDPTEVVVTSVPSELGLNQRALIQVEVHDNYGGVAINDNSTQITFSLSGNGEVYGIQDGFGDGSYGVQGGAETVQVINGVASILVSDDTVETLTVSYTNNSGLLDPSASQIDIVDDPSLGKVSVGVHTTLFLDASGALYGAGKNDFAQLDSSVVNITIPLTIMDSGIKDASIRKTTTYYVKNDGSLWGVGEGIDGELGNGQNSNQTVPVTIEASSVDRVEAGPNFVLYQKSDGSVWGVGRNSDGQLGDGSVANRNTPFQIYSSGIIDFTPGGRHSLFVKDDGSAWSVGYNFYGQLGDTTNTMQSTPVAVSGLSSNVIAVAAGESHSLFLKSDGSVWSVGQNNLGQLGDTTNTDRTTPVQIFSANVTNIYSGSYTSFFLMNDGSLWGTGQGMGGELGDGSSSDINTPIQILASGVQSVASWENVTLFLMDDGRVWGSGYELNGEMANGTTSPTNHYNRIVTGYPQSNTNVDDASTYTLSPSLITFNPAQGTQITLNVYDASGEWMNQENTLEFTLSVNNNAFIDDVNKGQGDGSYGVPGGSETIITRNGQVTVQIKNSVQEVFDLIISNNRSVVGPTSIVLISDINAVSPKVEAGRRTSFYITNTGQLFGAGLNDFGQIGDGTTQNRNNATSIFSSNVLDVASGYAHTVILKTDGSVWATGQNTYGQLGDGTMTNQQTPVEIFSANVTKVWAGDYHSLFLMNNNELWGVGRNDQGELGDGSNINKNSPILMATNVVDAAAGQHTMIVKTDGSLWVTGYNFYGQLGNGNSSNESSFIQILSTGVERVFAGQTHSFFLKTDGTLWGMGQGSSGQLGDGASVSYQSPMELISSGVSFMAGGITHSLMLKNDGSLWSFGNGTSGELGNGSATSESSPFQVESSGVTSISAGENYSIYIKNGKFYFMGDNNDGTSGDSSLGVGAINTPVTSKFPDLIGDPLELVVVSVPSELGVDQQGLVRVEVRDNFGGVAANDNSTVVTFNVSGNGEIFGVRDGFGDGSYGVQGGSEAVQVVNGVASVLLSDDTVETLTVSYSNNAGIIDPDPSQIEIVTDPSLGIVDVGFHTTIFMSADGALYGAGQNNYGQLADPALVNETSVVTIEESGVVDTSIGSTTTYYIKDDGSLWGVGQGISGQLGGGLNSDYSTPVEMESSSVVRVEAGTGFVLYQKDDGSIWGVGENTNGELGNGGVTNINTAAQIFASDIVDFAAGGSHSLFVKTDGSAWSTGYNLYGQLGDTTNTQKSTPVQVNGMSTNVLMVAAGEDHSLFLLNDGSVYATGRNGSGQLGLGHITDQNTPVMVFSGNISSIYAGSYNSFFLKNDGSLWATGQGVNGEFGDGSAADINNPVQVLAGNVQSVASWENDTLFLMNDGKVYGSGHEANGEMGIANGGTSFHYNRILTGYPQSQIQAISINNYTVKIKHETFNPAQGTEVTVRALDASGNIISAENSLEFTFSSNANSYIQDVMRGQGDGSYGTIAGTETITMRNGRIKFLINNQTDETFELTISNNRSVSGPAVKILTSDSGSATPSIEAGQSSSFYISEAGELWAAGRNDFFQLGDGSGSDQQEPVLVYGGNVIDVASGISHTLILKNDGSVDAVGQNNWGQLGDGTTINKSFPVQIFAANVIAIWAGQEHSLFLMNNQELWGVGKNDSGELGDGTLVNQNSPILISADVTSAAAGTHTLFVKSDGSLWSTGINTYGQLGDGSISFQSTPYQVEASGVEVVFAGPNNSFYLKEDGSLWAMGSGSSGELGDGLSVQQQNPVEVLSSGVVDLAAGPTHTLIIKEDESLWSFGSGFNGRLGTGTTTNESSPVMIESGNVSSVTAGQDFSLYIKDELVYFMGANPNGQGANASFGVGDTLNPSITNYNGGNTMMSSGNALVLRETTFASPTQLNRGSSNLVVMEWEFVGGGNVETLDSIEFEVIGDINDIERFELLDVTSGNSSVYAGNAMNGDVAAGNVYFTGSPQTVLVDEVRQYQLLVSVFESTNQNDIEVKLRPDQLNLSGGNLAQGNIVYTGTMTFTGSSNMMGNAQGLSDVSLVMGPAQTYLLDDGVLVTKGRDSFGELARGGDGNILMSTTLTNIISVDAGENHAIALGGNGEVYTWGSNLLEQSSSSGTPEMVTGVGNAIWVGAGSYNSYILNAAGQFYSTGRNHKGQLGVGTTSVSSNWTLVSLPAGNVEQIDVGIEHVLMIINGSLYGFGSNGFGQLNVDNATTPTLIDNSSTWVEIAAGGFHSLALSGNGSVFAWGKNSSGQLGLGYESPMVNGMNYVTGLSNIVDLAAGYNHSVFLEDFSGTRSLYTCGSDRYGQTGHNNLTNIPTLLSGEPNIDEVSTGPNSTIFSHSGQYIKMMGLDSDGSQVTVPLQIYDTNL